jgi:hypothetical protein
MSGEHVVFLIEKLTEYKKLTQHLDWHWKQEQKKVQDALAIINRWKLLRETVVEMNSQFNTMIRLDEDDIDMMLCDCMELVEKTLRGVLEGKQLVKEDYENCRKCPFYRQGPRIKEWCCKDTPPNTMGHEGELLPDGECEYFELEGNQPEKNISHPGFDDAQLGKGGET